MHQFSFDSGDPFFDLDGWQIGLQVITFENVYGLDPELTRVEEDGGCWTVTAEGLTWAGGQRRRGGPGGGRAAPGCGRRRRRRRPAAWSSSPGRSTTRRYAVSRSSCGGCPPAT